MSLPDYTLIILYLVAQMGVGFYRRLRTDSPTAEVILGGRMLTLPAFVASLVSTWYGGILGVSEYSYRYGVSNWLVFGVPYYLAAFLFALFLAKKARQSQALTIPDRLAAAYGDRTAAVGALVIFVMTVPAAYVLMLGTIGEQLFGWPFWAGVVLGTILSGVYLYMGGFRSVVRTDILQFVFMFLGFAVLVTVLVSKYGGWSYIVHHVPDTHLTWHGGRSGWYVAVWYVIALATLIEPAFFQRCYAAKSESVARNGIFISIGCWAVFDFMTTSCGLYAMALFPKLADPVAAYPILAAQELPSGLFGIFLLAVLATVMSTVDSYAFIAASTFGNDIMRRFGLIGEERIVRFTHIGLLVTMLLAIGLALMFRSVIDIWYAFGSIGTPALLIPVFTSFVGRRRLPPQWALVSILASGGLSLVWALSKFAGSSGDYWLGWQPVFPGLVLSLVIFGLKSRRM
ncbi:MAG: sodium:solute symporter family protein [Candidatus Zixiibacteriota bacterium]